MVSPDAKPIVFNFHESLAGLITRRHAHGEIRYRAHEGQSIKDMIESLGIPHTEIGGMDVHAHGAVDFSYQPQPGDRVRVSPPQPPVDVTQEHRLRSAFPCLRFLVDENVVGVLVLVRALGVDAIRDSRWRDADIARIAHEEQRVVLTRDRGLLKRTAIEHGRLLRSQSPDGQLAEVVKVYGLQRPEGIMGRCLRCNELLEIVEKQVVLHRLEPKTKQYYHEFRRCPKCGGVFWKGTHYEGIINRLIAAGVHIPQYPGATSRGA